MSWIQVIIQTMQQDTDQITEVLTDLGADAVTYQDAGDDPLFEPPIGETPLWQQVRVTALFDAEIDQDHLRQNLRAAFANAELTAGFSIEPLADQPWERTWMERFQPMQFGNDLWICPSWCPPPDPNAHNILLDPGLAFGSGTHPTTAMCLSWLATHDIRNKTVIDYGCGSGILAIAASKLGANKIYAVDIDPQALLATKSNCDNNHVKNVVYGFPDQLPEIKADLIIANILAEPLIQLAPIFHHYGAPHYQLLLSGLLLTQMPQVVAAYQPLCEVSCVDSREGWALLSRT